MPPPPKSTLRTPSQGCLFGTLDAEICRMRLRSYGKDRDHYPARRKDVVAGSPRCRIANARGGDDRMDLGFLWRIVGERGGTRRATRMDDPDQYEKNMSITPKSRSSRPNPLSRSAHTEPRSKVGILTSNVRYFQNRTNPATHRLGVYYLVFCNACARMVAGEVWLSDNRERDMYLAEGKGQV